MGKGSRAVLCLAALGSAAALGAGPVGRAGADGLPSFTALALAQASRATFTVPGFLALETLADGGAPVSQAQLTALGGRAFGSTAYPGDTATHTEQLSGAAGLPAPPAYPLYVEASHPGQPKAEAAPPGQRMVAEATADSAAGMASTSLLPASDPARPVVAAALSATRVDAKPDGSVVARAESVVDGASFPGGLRIARIDSVAVATLGPGADKPAVQTTTTVTGAEVAGTAIEIGPDGITGPQPAGLPSGSSAPAQQALAEAGISVRRISSVPVSGGASADVIEVRSTLTPPAPGLPASHARYDLGGATVSVLTGAGFGSPVPLPTPAVGESATTGPQPPTAPQITPGDELASPPAAGAAVPIALPATADTEAVSGAVAPGEEPSIAPASPAPGATAAPPPGAADGTVKRPASIGVARPAANLRSQLGLLYLVVILAGIAAFAVASVFRTKGVQRTWSS
jgi:hypothetical protein